MFKNNMKNGYGKDIFADGSVYEGEYVENIKRGRGTYKWRLPDGGFDVYEGEFVDDIYEGFGKYTWASGDVYEGTFEHNTIHGEGIYTWTSAGHTGGRFRTAG